MTTATSTPACIHCAKPLTADEHGVLIDQTGGDVCGWDGANAPHLTTSGPNPYLDAAMMLYDKDEPNRWAIEYLYATVDFLSFIGHDVPEGWGFPIRMTNPDTETDSFKLLQEIFYDVPNLFHKQHIAMLIEFGQLLDEITITAAAAGLG